MALPKRRHSKSRGRKRRANDGLNPVQTATCAHCGRPKLPHRVCGNCGYYGNREIVAFEE